MRKKMHKTARKSHRRTKAKAARAHGAVRKSARRVKRAKKAHARRPATKAGRRRAMKRR
ncbi:MAG TPA: hypothetical protein VLX85_15815 [Stellaceae bacterium]|nr:hypothetical protein [Stellaceae bacterium]